MADLIQTLLQYCVTVMACARPKLNKPRRPLISLILTQPAGEGGEMERFLVLLCQQLYKLQGKNALQSMYRKGLLEQRCLTGHSALCGDNVRLKRPHQTDVHIIQAIMISEYSPQNLLENFK